MIGLALVLWAAGPLLQGGGAPQNCGICHGTERVQHARSVHQQGSVTCSTCHGGDPGAVTKAGAHAGAKGFRGRIPRAEVATACGGCHEDVVRMRPFGLRTDALAAWKSSHHGQSITKKGDLDAATCTDCHGAHEVRRTSDPLSPAYRVNVPATCGACHGDAEKMKRHGLTGGPPQVFARSVHGALLSRGTQGVPSCADCHDAHASAPPGAVEVADVCGSCHREEREQFLGGPHVAASEARKMKQCVTCHGAHSVSRVDFSAFDAPADSTPSRTASAPASRPEGVLRCTACHDPKNRSDRAVRLAESFGRGFRDAEANLGALEKRIVELAEAGHYVDLERDALDRGRRELVKAVPLTHSGSADRVDGILRNVHSLVSEGLAGCDAKIREDRDRRIFGTGTAAVLLGIAGFLTLRRRKGSET